MPWQFSKAELDITNKLEPRRRLEMFEQFLKALPSMFSTLSGMVKFPVRFEQLMKQSWLTTEIFELNTKPVKEEQFPKALSPRKVTLFGITKFPLRFEHSKKARSIIVSMFEGKIKAFNDLHPAKA